VLNEVVTTIGSCRVGWPRLAGRLGVNRLGADRLGACHGEDALGRADQAVGLVSRYREALDELVDPVL
jgi:hypothetical protein